MDWLSATYFLVCATHALFAIYFLVGIWSISKPLSHSEPVTVIVAARNESVNLGQLLPLLLAQDYHDYEIVIALNETDDNSREVIANYAHERISVLDIPTIPPGFHPKKFAITKAVEQARYDALLFTDADCRPGPFWIREMANGFTRDIVLGYAPYSRQRGLIAALTDYETRLTAMQYIGSAGLDRAYMGVGRNLGYRKSLFQQFAGFKGVESVVGGDDDLLINKMAPDSRVAIQVSKESHVPSTPMSDWKSYIHQKTRHLHSGRHYRLQHKIFLAAFSLIHIGLFIGLANFFHDPYTALQFAFGYIPLLLAHRSFAMKTGDRFPWPKILLLDVMYVFFHIFVGIRALGTKRIEWTN